MRHKPAADERPLHWVGSSKRELLEFPGPVVSEIGWALGVAQFGGKHPAAKHWRGEGPRVLVYVLRCFQKKSPRGNETAKRHVDLVRERLMAAHADYEARYGKGQK